MIQFSHKKKLWFILICSSLQGLNELSEAQHWPFQFVDGYIGSVRVDVPWMNILSDNSRVHISGLMLTVQPKTWNEEASLFESMYSSMMSSKQMAEEIFRISEPATEPDVSVWNNLIEGIFIIIEL